MEVSKKKDMFSAEGGFRELVQFNHKTHISGIEWQDLIFVLLGFSLTLV